MKWLYYIPHEWETETVKWEDIYLMPDVPDLKESFWLTIDGFRTEDVVVEGTDIVMMERIELSDEDMARLKKDGCIIDGDNMLVKPSELTKEEVVEWSKKWLELSGYEVTEMVESTYDRFLDTNEDIRNIAIAIKRMKDYKKEMRIEDDE
jgi:hypothetical protein